jgi:hypothetical protein
VLHAIVGCKPLNISSIHLGRFGGVERKEAPPTAGKFDDDPLAAASAHHHSCCLEPSHVVRGAARRGMQDLVELADRPVMPESSEKPCALDPHKRI